MTFQVPATHVERLELVIGRAFQAVLVIEMAAGVVTQNWWVVFVTAQALLASALPAILARNTRLSAPVGFQLVLTAFIFSAIFLGEVEGFYERFWWWDAALHTSSGLILGLVGYLMLFTLFEQQRVRMSAFLLAAFAVGFAVAMGTVWELFEFVIDTAFGMRMQRGGLSDSSGLADTMSDLIVNALGAIAIVILAHVQMSHRRGRHWMRDLAAQFVTPDVPHAPRKAALRAHAQRHGA